MKTIIFVHIPKTGGTSLIKNLKRNFIENEVFSISEVSLNLFGEEWQTIPFLERQEKTEIYFKELPPAIRNSFKLIIGHMNYGWHRYLDNEFYYCTFLRNPIERVFSLYRYISEKRMELIDNKSDEFNIQEFIKSGHEEISNGITKRMASEGITIEEMYKNALSNINQFHFIGFTELINESLSYMSIELSLKTFNLGKENYTNKEKYTFTHKEIELIRSINKYDIDIYEKCVNKSKHKIAEFHSTHKKQKKLNFKNILNLFYNNDKFKKNP